MSDEPDDDPKRSTFSARLARLVGLAPPEQARSGSSSLMRLRLTEFETASVRDVMVSRGEVAAVDVEQTLGDVLELFAEEAHSRMPVYRDSLDDPIGFVHIKDVVAELVAKGTGPEIMASRPLDRLKREILFVAQSMRLADLLVEMQDRRIHMAVVVDEYGGTDGVVCLEDLVEQIVGDIEDEHDDEAPTVIAIGADVWEVEGHADIDDVETATGLALAVPDLEDEIETLGGLAFALAGRIPAPGETVEHPGGMAMDILEVSGSRVLRVRLRPAVAAAMDGDRNAAGKLAPASDETLEDGVSTSEGADAAHEPARNRRPN